MFSWRDASSNRNGSNPREGSVYAGRNPTPPPSFGGSFDLQLRTHIVAVNGRASPTGFMDRDSALGCPRRAQGLSKSRENGALMSVPSALCGQGCHGASAIGGSIIRCADYESSPN